MENLNQQNEKTRRKRSALKLSSLGIQKMNAYSKLFGLFVVVVGGILGLASLVMMLDLIGLSPF